MALVDGVGLCKTVHVSPPSQTAAHTPLGPPRGQRPLALQVEVAAPRRPFAGKVRLAIFHIRHERGLMAVLGVLSPWLV